MMGKNIDKNVIDKYSPKFLDNAKQSAAGAFRTASKRVIQRTAEATDDLLGNKIAERRFQKNTKISKKLQQNNSEAVTTEHDKEIPKEKYMSPEERQKTIDDLRSI